MALVYFYFYYITSQSLYSITQRIRISRLTTTPESTTPTLYEQCVGSLTSHSINIGKDCETGPTVFRPYPRRLESLTICRCHYKGSTFFSVIVKTLSVGPAGAWTRDLPLNRPVLSPELTRRLCFQKKIVFLRIRVPLKCVQIEKQ